MKHLAVRNVVLLIALALAQGCTESKPSGVDEAPIADTCIDQDGDGYGQDCDLGSDCDDTDPLRALSCPTDPEPIEPPEHCGADAQLPGCPCSGAETPIACYDGRDGTQGIGICHGGFRRCQETETDSGLFAWTRCQDQQLPFATERCNELDDNCDGRVDEGVLNFCGTCNPHCFRDGQGPASQSRPGQPFDEPRPDHHTGVGIDEDGNLILRDGDVRYESLWVANSSEGTISKVNTNELRESARFDSVGPNNDGLTPDVRNAPSRTGIDLNGDMFVANRAFGGQQSVTKIYDRDCIDRNGDGRLQTSTDANGNNVIDRDDPNEFFGQDDECFAWTKAVGESGGVARCLAIDAGDASNPHGNVWVGMYAHREFYGIQGGNGALIQRQGMQNPIPVGHSPYGAVVDSNGYVWSGTLSGCTVVGFDSTTGRTGQPFNLGCRSYGFTMDGDNRLWIGALDGGALRYDPYHDGNGHAIQDPLAGGGETRLAPCGTGRCHLRGGGADAEGRIWFANIDAVMGYRVDTMQFIGNFALGGSSMAGAGVDFGGFVWGVSGQGFTGRIDPDHPNDTRRVTVGAGPYTYSDFTGFSLRSFTAPRGAYKAIIEGCEKFDTNWLTLDVQAITPPNTRLEFRAKTAASIEELSDAGLSVYGPWVMGDEGINQLPANLTQLPGGRFIELEVFLISTAQENTPVLRGFDVRYECQPE